MSVLASWGWDDEWAGRLAGFGDHIGTNVARVAGQERDRWSVQTELGPATARLPSRARLNAYPAVGDWVVVEQGPMVSDPWSIVNVLPRRSSFSRAAAHDGAAEQVLAANVDTVWIVHGLDAPVNARRLERYLALAWESGASPEIVLTKSDLARDPDEMLRDVEQIAFGIPIRLVSTLDLESVQTLRLSLQAGKTVALLGPSGVGKSTLVNLLADRSLTGTGDVRTGDRKGRHTTTSRQLYRLPGGSLLVDTPGMRELRVWELSDGLDLAFPEIEDIARQCRFRDCLHDSEPGCAVAAAMAEGRLDPERLASYRKLLAEAAFQARKSDARLRAAATAEHKAALKTLKHHHKYRNQA